MVLANIILRMEDKALTDKVSFLKGHQYYMPLTAQTWMQRTTIF